MSKVALSRFEVVSARLGRDEVSREVLRELCARHQPGQAVRVSRAVLGRDLGHPAHYVALALFRLAALQVIREVPVTGVPYQLSDYSLTFLEEADACPSC